MTLSHETIKSLPTGGKNLGQKNVKVRNALRRSCLKYSVLEGTALEAPWSCFLSHVSFHTWMWFLTLSTHVW